MKTKSDTWLTIRLPQATLDEIRARAEAEYRTVSAEVRLALDTHLSNGREKRAA